MQSPVYCVTCGKMVGCVVNDRIHLIPSHAFAICEGPFASCPPPDDGAFLIPEDTEPEVPEPTIEDIHYIQNLETLLAHITQ